MRFRFVLASILPILSTPVTSAVGQHLPPLERERIEAIDRIAREAQAAAPFAGMTVLAMRGEVPVFARAYGLADVEGAVPATMETAYGLASITKQFTSAAILRLAEQGRLSLDDELAKFFPEFAALGTGITVRRLLNHTSGVSPSGVLSRHPELRSRSDVPSAERVRIYAAEPLAYTPAAEWRYNGVNTFLLAAIVEKLTGQRFADYLEGEILRPLGLKLTIRRPEIVIPHRAGAYRWSDGRVVGEKASPPWQELGAGGLVGSAADVARWTRALAKGRVVAPASYAEMITPATLADGTSVDYGLGLALGELQGHRKIFHVGGAHSIAVYYPDTDLTVVILTNTRQQMGLVRKIEQRIARVLLGLPEPNDLPIPADRVAGYTGEYHAGGIRLRIVDDGGRLRVESRRWNPQAATVPIHLLHQGNGVFLADFDAATRLTFRFDGSTATSIDIEQGGRRIEARRASLP